MMEKSSKVGDEDKRKTDEIDIERDRECMGLK